MNMYNPPHPGKIIKGLWLEPMNKSITEVAAAMGISRNTLSNIINGKASITPEIAVRLSITLGSSAESWMGHQVAFDLWQVEQRKTELHANPLFSKKSHTNSLSLAR